MDAEIHPSLRAYINCFLSSPPFPRMFPRVGGYQDQDPILMRDFRFIAKYEREWKDAQEKSGGSPNSISSEHADRLDPSMQGVEDITYDGPDAENPMGTGGGDPLGGGAGSLGDALNQMLAEQGLEDSARF